jgi:acetolactate synthase regulatory subunit
MCNHSFCNFAKLRKCHHQISSNKIIIWIYVGKNMKICLVKEKYRNYDPMKDYLKNIDEDCYEKALTRILKMYEFRNFDIHEIFSPQPKIAKYQNSMVFIGKLRNINLFQIKKKLDGYFENINLFPLYREPLNGDNMTMYSIELLNKSFDEDWINFYKI